MTRVRVKLLGLLRDKAPADGIVMLSGAVTVREVLRTLDIPPDQIQAVAVNGRLEPDEERRLGSEDELTVLPPVTGGRGREPRRLQASKNKHYLIY